MFFRNTNPSLATSKPANGTRLRLNYFAVSPSEIKG